MKNLPKILFRYIFRNSYSREGNKSIKRKVNLEFFRDNLNLGDCLSPIICEYMLSLHSLSLSSSSYDKKTKHLMALGSILGGRGNFNAIVWGSGVSSFSAVNCLWKRKFYQQLDIRAVRGPITFQVLNQCGFKCSDNYGDPAVLMPLIYKPKKRKKQGIALVLHYLSDWEDYSDIDNLKLIDIKTDNYKSFIDEISSSEKVISSSLHGIILAETYGIPAVFLNKGMDSVLMKFYDWYYSTGRYNVKMATSIDEAIKMEPMSLPKLEEMCNDLISSFPYDLWEKE